MAVELPRDLAHWIRKHEGIVQPYALSALAEMWVREVSAVRVTVRTAPPPSPAAPPMQLITPQAAIVDTGIPDLVERLARGGLRMGGAAGGGGGPCQVFVVVSDGGANA